MSKDAIISSLLSLPDSDQREIRDMLNRRFELDEFSLSDDQLKELDARIERFQREGSTGRPWETVRAEIEASIAHARHKN